MGYTMSEAQIEARRRGGNTTLERHGREHFVKIGQSTGGKTRVAKTEKAWREWEEAQKTARKRKKGV